tara:strand:+ start:388 stop:663 length:276 start_codon:yes stop_codon:yes gene_type:complete
MNVKIIKLVSAEELIADFDEEKYIAKNPVIMIPVSKEQIAFQPWLPYAEDKEYQLKESQITLTATPSDTIKAEYTKHFGSGIVTPRSNIVM